MKIAVDFDGTIVQHRYPKVGKEIPFAIITLKQLIKDGHDLILWTYRAGKELEDAVDFCKKKGVVFYAVNKDFPEEVFDSTMSRKIIADVYIDDRNFGGLPDWGEIYVKLSKKPLQPQSMMGHLKSVFKKR